MLDKPITIIDIETTGMSARSQQITEVGVLKVDGDRVLEEYTTLINPGRSIPAQITQLTGIRNEDVADAPYFADIADKIAELFADSYFMAHNVLFDFSFVKRQMKDLNYNFTPRLLCSVKLSRALYPQARSHSLENIIRRHNILVTDRHRALADTQAVHEFINLARKEHGEETVAAALEKQLKRKSLPPNLDEKHLEGIENVPGVYIFKDQHGIPVYIGKSKTLRNRILSHFSQATSLDKEMKISANTHSVEVIKTGSELEALLLESKLIKEKMPLYNIKLRSKRTQTILTKQENDAGYNTVKLFDGKLEEFDQPESIFGIYDNRTKAKTWLTKHRDTFDLCSKLLGLERTKGSCFHYQLGKCRGACIEKEKPADYNLRFELAFERSRIQSWKYKTPILITLSATDGIIVDHWKIIGRLHAPADSEPQLEPVEASFDLDTYKILRTHLKTASVTPFDPGVPTF